MTHMPSPSPTEFETLTAAHLEQYRPPTGALTHPRSVTVVDPHDVDTPERAAARVAASQRWAPETTAALCVFVSALAMMVSLPTVVVVEELVGLEMSELFTLFMMFGSALLATVATLTRARIVNKKINAICSSATSLRQLQVPADVATAYAAFSKTPTRLRAASAGEDIVGVVEARMGHMEDLLVEAARLHALGADATEDGLAVREQIVTHAAKAQSLVVMAQRKAVAIADADAGTALVLGRVSNDTAFEDAGAQLADDTQFVRNVLDGTSVSAAILAPVSEREVVR